MTIYLLFLVFIISYVQCLVKTIQKENASQDVNETLPTTTVEPDNPLTIRQFQQATPCSCFYRDSCGCLCQNPISWEDFQLLPQHFRSCPSFTLAIRGGTFHSFPADYFYRVGDIQDFVLDVGGVEFEYLLDPGGDASPLNRVSFEVSGYLRFYRVSVARDWNWGGFFDLSPSRSTAYCEIQVVHSTVPLLKADFGRICKGVVTVVNVNYCGTMALENRVFTSFYKLTEVDLSNNRIRVLMRSYFPHPANELAVFNLSYNDIRSLPSDMFYGMPVLESVDLRGNPITSIEEAAIMPYFGTVKFIGFERFNNSKKQKTYSVMERERSVNR